MNDPNQIVIRMDQKTAERLLNMVIREVHRIDKMVQKNGFRPEAADDIRNPMFNIISQFNLHGVE